MYAEMERLGTNLNEIDTTDCENSLESLQQMAVKLYEKDPSKLTAEPLPTLSNIDDDEDEDDDEEDSNQAADIKEEPVDVTTVDENPPPIVPDTSQAVWAATAFPTPHLLTSGQEDPSTDSDTVNTSTESA